MTRPIAMTLGAALAAVLLAAPAAAQKNTRDDSSGGSGGGWGGFGGGGAPVCGQPGGQVTWMGGSADASDIAYSAGPFYLQTDINGTEPSFFAFTVGGPAFLRLEARGTTGGDTVLTLLDDGGYELSYDDDSGGELASRLEIPVDAGTYCIAVQGYDNNPFPAEIQVGRDEHIPITVGVAGPPECTAETEAAILTDLSLDGVLASGQSVGATVIPAEQRYWRFTLARPSQMSIRAENEEADPVLRLYDPDGYIIAENDDADGYNSLINVIDALAPGSYCIEVSALGDEGLPISLTVEPFDEVAYLNAAYAAGQIPPPPGGTYPVADLGTLTNQFGRDLVMGNDAKWVSFSLAEPSLVLIRASGGGVTDPMVRLFGPSGDAISENDDASPGDVDSMLARELSPGTYMVAIMLFEGTSAGNVRLSLDRYVHAR